MIKGVIFDLDGTLLNTLKDIKEALNNALRKYHYQEVSLEQTRMFIGNGGKELVQRALNFQNVEFKENVLLEFRNYYFNHQIDFTFIYEGIDDLLKELLKSDIKIAVASNKYYKTAIPIIEKFFPNQFVSISGSSENMALKPSPDIIYLTLRNMNLKAEECLYVGDSEIDILTAKNFKMKVVSVLWGYRDRALLETYNPDYLIKQPLELINIIKKENHQND